MYDPKSIESKWQKHWQDAKVFKTRNPVTPEDFKMPKYYTLDMFPYPSGEGLHVGHPKGYTANDIVARYKHAKGFRVLHPMGWDSFGLPAENYAIKTGIHPSIKTGANINTFKKQIQSLGLAYDWDREIATTDPEYYRWTQWIFLKLFEAGLAYEQDLPINYCPSCKTGLANEEVLADRSCDRCGTIVERRKLRQWVLAITKYAERLLEDVDKLDWPEGIKEMQRNWIGKSEGVEFDLAKADDTEKKLSMYTTRIDTVYGMTYVVIAPDHPDVDNWITTGQKSACEKYITEAKSRSDQDRTNEGKEKTGVFTGSYAINPFNGKQVPVWIADYVLGSYGTGAVMAVPAHDERDFEFAKKYELEVIQSIASYTKYTPKEGKETEKRNVGVAIVRNPKDNTYLCLDWKTTTWKSFPAGGLDGNDLISGTKREVQEETGYKNLKFIRQIGGSVYEEFYRPHKDSNVFAHFQHALFELENEEKLEVAEKESDQHGIVWVPEDEIESFLNIEHQKKIWKIYKNGDISFCEDGILVNSGEFNGLKSEEARERMAEWVEGKGVGKKKINYKLRDWLFSRQRYWGEPIPLVHIDIENLKQLPHITDLKEATDPKMAYILKRKPKSGENCVGAMCGDKARVLIIDGKEFSKVYDGIYSKIVCDYRLPLELPEVERYEPSGNGDSPLALVPSFVNVELASNLRGRRETNTMPQWAGSCWYYLRFMDPDNTEALVDPRIVKYWGEVDSYVGGAEHAVLHLLYARFWHKFLFDIGVVSTDEPFYRLRNQGLILGPDGNKMSKSKGNVINPDGVVEQYGADTLRLYEMSMADFKDPAPWNTDAIIGVRRFLERVWKNFAEELKFAADDTKAMKLLHKTIKKVGEDIDIYKFNTAISALMILINGGLPRDDKLQKEWKEVYLRLLHPFAPHIAEELWAALGHADSIYNAKWPKYDENMIQDDEVTIAVQVNGKLRGTYIFDSGVSQEEVAKAVLEDPEIVKWVEGKEIIKQIFVPNKLFSIVVK